MFTMNMTLYDFFQGNLGQISLIGLFCSGFHLLFQTVLPHQEHLLYRENLDFLESHCHQGHHQFLDRLMN